MGNKTNPLSLRVQSEIRFFESHWYSDLYYQSLFRREFVIRQHLTSLFKQIGACAIGTRQAQINISIQNLPKKSNVVFFYQQSKGLMKFLQECFVKKRGEKILKKILRYSRKRRRLIKKKLRTGSICIKASALSTRSATLPNGYLIKLFDRKQKSELFINDYFDPKKPENLKSLQSSFVEKRGASSALRRNPYGVVHNVSLSVPTKCPDGDKLFLAKTMRHRVGTAKHHKPEQRKQRSKADWPFPFAQGRLRSYVSNKVSRKEERSYVNTLNPLKKEWRRQFLKLPINEQLKHLDVERNFVKILKKKTFKNSFPFDFFKRFGGWLEKQTMLCEGRKTKNLIKKKKGFMTDNNFLYFHTKLSKTASLRRDPYGVVRCPAAIALCLLICCYARRQGAKPVTAKSLVNRPTRAKQVKKEVQGFKEKESSYLSNIGERSIFLLSTKKKQLSPPYLVFQSKISSFFCNSRESAQMISSKKLAILQPLLMKNKWVTALSFLQLQQVAKTKQGSNVPVYSNFTLNDNSCIAYSEKKKNRKMKIPSLKRKELASYSSSIPLSEPFQANHSLTKKEMSGFALRGAKQQGLSLHRAKQEDSVATAKPFFTVLEKKEKLEASKKKVVMLLLLFRSVKNKQSQNYLFSSAFLKRYPRRSNKEELSLSTTNSKCKIDLIPTLLKSILKKKNKKFIFEKVTVLRFFLITALFSNFKNETPPLSRLFQKITRFARFKAIKK